MNKIIILLIVLVVAGCATVKWEPICIDKTMNHIERCEEEKKS